MGFDLTVPKGYVRLAEVPTLMRERLEFGAKIELDIIPVNWIVSGSDDALNSSSSGAPHPLASHLRLYGKGRFRVGSMTRHGRVAVHRRAPKWRDRWN